MSAGDWRAELAWRVISSPAAKEFATSLLDSKGWLAPAPTGTGPKSNMGNTTMTDQEKKLLKTGREVLTQFAVFLDSRAVEVEEGLPEEVAVMRSELVQSWLQGLCEKLMDKDEWQRQDMTRLAAVLFWMAVAMVPPTDEKGPNK